MKALAARFVEESSLELHSFLSSDLANAIETRLRELDTKDGLGEERAGQMPAHTAGTDGGWVIKGPPHKWRYCALKPQEEGRPAEAVTPRAAYWSSDQILRSLQDELFSSEAFRVWLAFVSRLMPMSYSSEARRFRPGLDYTLATSEDSEARLDAVLGLTPMVQDSEEPMQGRFGHGEPEPRGWQTALWGGWEVGIICCVLSYIYLVHPFKNSVIWLPTTKRTILQSIARVIRKNVLLILKRHPNSYHLPLLALAMKAA